MQIQKWGGHPFAESLRHSWFFPSVRHRLRQRRTGRCDRPTFSSKLCFAERKQTLASSSISRYRFESKSRCRCLREDANWHAGEAELRGYAVPSRSLGPRSKRQSQGCFRVPLYDLDSLTF